MLQGEDAVIVPDYNPRYVPGLWARVIVSDYNPRSQSRTLILHYIQCWTTYSPGLNRVPRGAQGGPGGPCRKLLRHVERLPDATLTCRRLH